jgi:hypothetical protein
MTSAACSVCGWPIDPVAGRTHPACDPTPEAEEIRTRHREWVAAGAPAGGRTTTQKALDIIRAAAVDHQFLDANVLRDRFDRADVPGPARGPAWARAIRAGLVEPVGFTPSTQARTNGHRVAQYRSLLRSAA